MPRTLLPVLLFVAHLPVLAQTQTAAPKAAYDFSLSREEKIKLAKSAAPAEVPDKATVYILERTGYVKTQDGTNGFSCFVDRQTPLNQEPTCFDAEGSATTLQTRFFAEEQRAQGKSEEEIKAAIDAGYKSGKYRAPGKPGIVYMLSDNGYLYFPGQAKLIHIPGHLMFYAPYATEKDLGSPPAAMNMPRVIRPGQPDAVMIVFPASGSKDPLVSTGSIVVNRGPGGESRHPIFEKSALWPRPQNPRQKPGSV